MSSDFLSPSRMEEEDRRRRDRIHQKLTDERGGKSVTAPVPDFLRHEDTEESRRKWDLIRQDTVNRDGAGPDAQAEALKTARDNDAPVESVLENPDLYGSAGGFSEAQAGRIAKDRPVTARTMARPDTGPAVADDGETLSFFERAYQHLGTKWTKGTDTVELKRLGVRAMAAAMEGSPMSPEMRKQVAELEGRVGAPEGENPFVGAVPDWAVRSAQTFLFVSSWGLLDFGGREMTDLVAEAPSVVTEMLPMTLHNMANSWDEVLKGGLVGTAVGAAGGPLAPVTMPVAVAGGLSAGMTTGIILETARSEGALAYFEYLKMTDSSGDLIGRDAALGGALIVGGLSGLLEVVAFGKLADTIPGLKTLRAMGRDEVRQTIARNPAVREVLARFGKQVALAGMSESAVEAMQQATQLIVADVGLGQDYTAGQYVEQLAHAARAGLQGGAGMGAGFSAPATAVEVTKAAVAGRQRKAQANAEAMRQVMARAKESKVLRRASDIFRQHIGDLEAEYGEVEVTASPEVVRTLFQDADPETLAKAPETLRNLAEAEETGGEVAIPMGELVEIAARQEIEAAIPDLRVNGELTEREAEVAVAETEASAEQMQADAEVAQDRTARLEQATAQVAENVLEQLSEAGQLSSRSAPMATMLAEGIVTQADRAGIDPVEFYESLGLEIRQSDIAELQAEDQAVEALAETETAIEEAGVRHQAALAEGNVAEADRIETEELAELTAARDVAAAEIERRPAVTRLLEQSVALREKAEALKIETPLTKSGKPRTPKTREVAGALERRTRERFGTMERNDRSPEARDKIAGWIEEEALYELERPGNTDSGVGWYSAKFQAALDSFGEMFPELTGEMDKSLAGVALLGTQAAARDFFTALIAITSDGQKVYSNFRLAARIYADFREAGKLDPGMGKSGGERGLSITQNIGHLQEAFDRMGPEGMVEEMLKENTVSELSKEAKDAGVQFSTSYPASVMLPRAAIIFGPKLGAFFANLMGREGYLTMDRWWSRTINRYRGQLLTKVLGTEDAPTDRQGKKIGLARYKEIIERPEISDDEAMVQVAEDHATYKAKGFKKGTDAEKAANTIYKAAYDGIEDQPFNPTDRKLMIEAVNQARDALAARGHEVTVADVQAILWYYEKRLYGELGARQTADVSYADVARRIIGEGPDALHRPGGRADSGAGGDVVQGPDGAVFPLEQRTGKGGPRGFIELGDKIRVTLTGKANASTFLHESGHLYLEILERMAEVGSDQQRADLQTIRDWVGAAPGEAFTTKQHEQFARGFEAYLREGKAPSRALAEAFSRFKTWLLTVYSSISKLDVELTDDVRGVMDRLLATDAAIAEQAQEMTPDPGLVEELGPEYRDSWLAALRAAQEAIDREAIAELKRQETEEEKATRQRIREVVVADVDARRAIRARYTMMRGELPDGTPAPPGIDKLSTEAVRGYGPKYTKRHAFLLSKDGAHPDTVAEFFGYENGQEMLDDIATTEPRKEIIAAEVEAQMKAEYGDIMERIEEAAAEATHVDETAHYLDLELRALRRQAPTKGRKAPSRVIREQARNKVRSMELWRLKPASYLAAERRARRLATEALVAGDRDAAAHHKAQELMAHHMYRETVRVREEGEKARKRLSRYTRPKVRANIGKAGEDYLDAIDELLDRVELRPVSGTEIQRRIDLGTFVARKKDEGEPIEIPEHLLLATEQRNWKQMNIDELIELREAADNIAHVARRKNDLVYRKERRDLNKTVREIETTSEKYLTRTVRDRFYTPTLIGEASELLEWASAGMVKIEFLAELLDGKVAGLAHEIIFQPLADAQAAAFTMLKKLKKDVFNPFRRMPREQRVRWSQKHQFMGQSLQGAQIISVALNVGNEGNLEKLVAGYADIGWTRDGVLDALDKWMTKADWDLVQHVWDSLETLRDPLFDVTRKLTGVRPPAIEAVAIETRHGTYRGGYFPVAYDPRQSHLAFQHQEKKALGHFENNFMAPAVRSTATKTRTNYSAPILLNLDVIGRHLVEQVQFITHAEAVYQVNKVIRHEGFRKLVTETLGARYYQALNPWLQNVAMGGRPSSMEERTWMSSAAGYVRQGTSMAYLGLNMRTGALQILGLATALVSLPPHWIAYGMTQALNPLGWAKYLENSPEAKQMFVQSDREVREALSKETGLRGAGLPRRGLGATVGALKYVAFSPIIILQAYVNAAVWHGAYAQALRRGDGIERSKNYAQAQVRMTQSGAGPKDLAAIQRGNEGMKLFFMFNTFFSVLYNRFFIALKKHGSIKGSPILAAELATLAVVPTLLIMAATELVSDEDDEYDDQPGWAMASMLYAASTIPFLRDILAGAFGQYGYTPTPVAGTLRDLAGAGAAVGDAVMEDKELTDKDLEKIFDSLGLVFKLPARGARKGAQFLFGED